MWMTRFENQKIRVRKLIGANSSLPPRVAPFCLTRRSGSMTGMKQTQLKRVMINLLI